MLALERDQGRLHAHAEGFHRILLAVVIHYEEDEILELGVGRKLAQNWLLLGADRTPGGVDINQDRLSGFLRRCKSIRRKRLGFGCKCRVSEDSACGRCDRKRGEERGAS